MELKLHEAYALFFREYPDVVNATQMCEMLGGISLKTGYRLLKSKKIKSFIVGGKYCIPKINLFQYLELAEKMNV